MNQGQSGRKNPNRRIDGVLRVLRRRDEAIVYAPSGDDVGFYRGLHFQCTRADNGSPAFSASRWSALIIGDADINRSIPWNDNGYHSGGGERR